MKTVKPMALMALEMRIVKALGKIASTDKSRAIANLAIHRVDAGPVLVATDGHCLVRVSVEEKDAGVTVFKPGLFEPKHALAKMKAGLEPEVSNLEVSTFPEVDRVMPPPTMKGDKVEGRQGFDAKLLARVFDVVGAIIGEKTAGAILQLSDDGLGPMRIDAKAYGLHVVALAMPMRVKGLE